MEMWGLKTKRKAKHYFYIEFLLKLQSQGGTSISGGRGGLGPDIKFRGKIWGKVQPSSPNKGKIWEVLLPQDGKSWERITILGAFGVISEIQTAKFGVFVTYIFGGKIWGSYRNFRGKIWGQSPRPPYLEVPPWDFNQQVN